MRTRTLLVWATAMAAAAAAAAAPAEITVSPDVLRPAAAAPPLGVNDCGRMGAMDWAANNFIPNPGNEPVVWRNLHRVRTVADDGSLTIDGGGESWYQLWASGFLSGAKARVYRLVDAQGQPLPAENGNLDARKAARFVKVADTRVAPEGTPGLPDGGWIVESYAAVHDGAKLKPDRRSFTDTGLQNGRTYWYTVVALGTGNMESDDAGEASATPHAGAGAPPSAPPSSDDSPVAVGKGKPAAPTEIAAVAYDGAVTVTWKAAPEAEPAGYSIRRSTQPKAKQRDRVVLAAGAPPVRVGDYLVVEREFGSPDMRYVNTRVRGLDGNYTQPGWYWRTDLKTNALSLVPHPTPLPAELDDAGRTCLQLKAGAGPQELYHFTCISPGKGGESRWYGCFETGRTYRVEFWLRQEGLADGGKVVFDLHNQLPQVSVTWTVDGTWRKYTYEFVAPTPPTAAWHYGPALHVTGPGTLWLDNGRLSRIDRPEDAAKPYVPGRLVLDELLKSQPATGRKGSHRTWYLQKDATMEGLTAWHPNSRWQPNWNTTVGDTLGMTLPMGLEFDRLTGDGAATRMRPWIVLQHLLHSEEDWRGLIEYLAAPYDPAKDSPQTKPWAYKRFCQRGHGRPWTDEFASIAIQFGNETWHNGVFDDWLGFSWRGSVWQGGREYGLAMQYLCDEIRKSPWWASEKLDTKIRFVVDGGYVNNAPAADGTFAGTAYGGLAMQASTTPQWLGQANYVGPKWETGDKSADAFTEAGLQEVLLGYVAGTKDNQDGMAAAWTMLGSKGRPYELVAYEGGPSGFALPGKGSPQQVETNERYGKSQAMAVAALDAWLGSYRQGWTEQCYLGFGMGTHWNSHTVIHEGFRPCPGWLALTLRNRFASGDLVKAEVAAAPTLAKGKGQYPLVGAYAMRDGRHWSVFLLSRSVATPVPATVKLPFKAASRVAVHRLAAAPGASNRERAEVAIESLDLPPTAVVDGALVVGGTTGGGSGGLAPGSILLYSIDESAP